MAKVTLNNITSGFQSNLAANINNALIEAAFENTLSRDGTSPNQMLANLDMNGHRILNLPIPMFSTEAARLADVQAAIAGSYEANFITFYPDGIGAVPRTLQDKNRDIVSVFDFMSAAQIEDVRARTGLIDVTIAIQTAIDAIAAAGGGTLYFPAGVYYVTATLIINSNRVSLVGSGMWHTKILRDGDYGNTLIITGNDVTGVVTSDVGVSGFMFESAGLTTSGAHIRANGIARVILESLYIRHGFIGFDCSGVSASIISNIYLVFSNNFGGTVVGRRYITMSESAATYSKRECADLFVSDFNFRGSIAGASGCFVEHGLWISCSDGVWLSNGHIGNTTISDILISATVAGIPVSLFYSSNVMLDEGTGSGLRFEGSTINARNLFFSNTHMKGGGNSVTGISNGTNASAQNVQFTGGGIIEFTSHGVSLNSTGLKNFSFDNFNVQGNSYGNPSVSNGYQLTSCKGVRITGGKSGGQNVVSDMAGDQAFGISVGAAALDIKLTGVDLKYNAVLGLSVNSAASAQVSSVNCDDGVTSTAASAATVTLPSLCDVVSISGTTTITSITASWMNRKVTLIFQDILTLTDGSNLKLAGNFVTTADDTITLVCDGTTWYEVARSIN